MQKPILVQTNLWESMNKINNLKVYSKNAQLFHRDFDNEKWIKVFVYLNDIEIQNGPHCFVKGSQNKIINKYIRRESDTYIKTHFKKKDIKIFLWEKKEL